MSVRMKTATYSRGRVRIADYLPPVKHERPKSWDAPMRANPDPYNKGTRGVPSTSKSVDDAFRKSMKKMIDLSPDEYRWLPEQDRLPRTPREKRKWLDAMRRHFQTAKTVAKYLPWLRMYRNAQNLYDVYQWAKRQGVAEHPVVPPGYSCYSYSAAIDLTSADCNREYHLQSQADSSSAVNCSTWHYQNQVIRTSNIMNGLHELVIYGPKQGGIYGCQRYNFAHVWKYPQEIRNTAFTPYVEPAVPARTLLVPTLTVPLPLAVDQGYAPDPKTPRPNRNPLPYQEPGSSYQPPFKGPPLKWPAPHNRLPPKKGEKEKKGSAPVPQGFKMGAKAYGAWTEFADFADAMYEGVPQSKQRPYQNPFQKLGAVWDNWDSMDWRKAFEAFALAQAKDYAIGKANSETAKRLSRNPYWKRPVGPGAGNWAQRYNGRIPRVVE